MNLKDKTEVFEKLGIFLEQFSNTGKINSPMPWLEELNNNFFQPMESVIQNCHINNPWFTEDNVRLALAGVGKTLRAENIVNWLSCYRVPDMHKNPKTIAVIMAGNIPLAGFHDMLCVLISGHRLLAKLSLKDDQLPKIVAEVICFLNSDFAEKIEFKESRLKDFDAVIATGSGNTSRYFDCYFGKYPNIIRKNRTSVAIIEGAETNEELNLLSDDVFRYFGLGCRSVSTLFVPENYDFKDMLQSFSVYNHLLNHNQWANNYEYQKAVNLIDQIPHLDAGFLILKEDNSLASPIAVINYQVVESIVKALEITNKKNERLQCVVGNSNLSKDIVPFGKAQEPGLTDYADNVDTMEFLLNL